MKKFLQVLALSLVVVCIYGATDSVTSVSSHSKTRASSKSPRYSYLAWTLQNCACMLFPGQCKFYLCACSRAGARRAVFCFRLIHAWTHIYVTAWAHLRHFDLLLLSWPRYYYQDVRVIWGRHKLFFVIFSKPIVVVLSLHLSFSLSFLLACC